MRISSKLSILAFIVGFLTIFMPIYFLNEYALTWLDIQESPPLWIYLAATIWVGAHDIGLFNSINLIKKSNTRVVRVLLLALAIAMAYSLELSVNVWLSEGNTFWVESLRFIIPTEHIQNTVSLGYHVIRLCRMLLIFTLLFSFIEKPTHKQFELSDKIAEKVFKEKIE